MRTALCILCVIGVAHLALGASSGPIALRPDEEVLGRARTLSLDDRRQLVYLYARLNRPKVAEVLAEQILTENPRDRQVLLVLASMYVEQQDADAVLRLARRFLEYYPRDQQGVYFLAAGQHLARQAAEANRTLRDLKQEQFSRERFPYETDLAAAAAAAGDWRQAMISYQELLRHHPLADELRSEVRRALDTLYREHLPRLEASAATTELARARVWRYGATRGRHLGDRQWLDVRYARDDVQLEAAPGLRAARADRAEGAASLTTIHDRRWRSEVSMGAGREGWLAGARLRFTWARERELAFEIGGNERATDSLALEALNGRQDRVALVVNWLVEADLVLAGRWQARDVYVGGARLGRGTGFELSLDQVLWRQGPRVTVGYRGSLGRFSPVDPGAIAPARAEPIAALEGGPATQAALLASLISRRLNRHGTGLLIAGPLTHAWAYRFAAGVDYDFELQSTGWNAGLGLVFFPRKSLEFGLEGSYSSSASASNAGSAATILSVSVRSHY